MRTIEEQKKRYNDLWDENSSTLAQRDAWLPDLVPIYTIGIWLSLELQADMQSLIKGLRQMQPEVDHKWLTADQLHITLDLPGRLGKHFQQEDIPKMIDWLQEICQETKPFEIELGNISCFSAVLFRQIYDKKGNIYKLHDFISEKIPWSQHPEYRHENFTPHMSFGYLISDATPIVNHPNFKREQNSTEMKVSSIYFNKWYDGEEIIEIEDIENIELGTGRLLGKEYEST